MHEDYNMTTNQLSYILKKYNCALDTWCVLPADVESVNLLGDVNILNNPLTINFYFSSSGVLFIRRLNGKPYPTLEDAELADDYVRIEMNDNFYDIKMMPYGITTTNKNIGKYHESIALSTIVGFVEIGADYYRPRNNVKKIAIKTLTEKIDIDTLGDTIMWGERDIFIYPVYSDELNDKDSYKTIIPKGIIKYNTAEDKYLMLVKFYSNRPITHKAYVLLNSEQQTEYIGKNFLYSVVNIAKKDQIIDVSFDGNQKYRIKIIVDFEKITLKR